MSLVKYCAITATTTSSSRINDPAAWDHAYTEWSPSLPPHGSPTSEKVGGETKGICGLFFGGGEECGKEGTLGAHLGSTAERSH